MAICWWKRPAKAPAFQSTPRHKIIPGNTRLIQNTCGIHVYAIGFLMYATERNLHGPKPILATTKFRTKQLCGTPEFNLQTTKIFLEKNMKLLKLTTTLATTGLLALTTIASNLAVADDDSGWYVGVNI